MTSGIYGDLYTLYWTTFHMYIDDKFIFDKASRFLDPYRIKTDLAFDYQHIESTLKELLGFDITTMIFEGGDPLGVDNQMVKWNRTEAFDSSKYGDYSDNPIDLTSEHKPELFDSFERDLKDFYIINGSIIDNPIFVQNGFVNLFGFHKMEIINRDPDGSEVYIKMLRNDGVEFAISLTEYDLINIINALTNIKNNMGK